MQIDLGKPADLIWKAVDACKRILGVVAVVIITIALLRAYGVQVPWFRQSFMDLAALAAAAAYISR